MRDQSPGAILRAEPDGYDTSKQTLMGRHSAGRGFLRAAVAARGDRPVYGYTSQAEAAKAFRRILASIDPAASFQWVRPDDFAAMTSVGVVYTADPSVPAHALQRMRAGVDAYSICGVTHTTATLGTMDDLVGLLREPVMPWDALVCTSTSVVETVRKVHAAEAEYLHWRHGVESPPAGPQLPVIPLGVHCDDFAFSPQTRADKGTEKRKKEEQGKGQI